MDVKKFYKTQRELANVLNSIIDMYWDDILDEDKLVNCITTIYIYNERKMYKNDKFTSVLLQVCGKRRLDVISKILKLDSKI